MAAKFNFEEQFRHFVDQIDRKRCRRYNTYETMKVTKAGSLMNGTERSKRQRFTLTKPADMTNFVLPENQIFLIQCTAPSKSNLMLALPNSLLPDKVDKGGPNSSVIIGKHLPPPLARIIPSATLSSNCQNDTQDSTLNSNCETAGKNDTQDVESAGQSISNLHTDLAGNVLLAPDEEINPKEILEEELLNDEGIPLDLVSSLDIESLFSDPIGQSEGAKLSVDADLNEALVTDETTWLETNDFDVERLQDEELEAERLEAEKLESAMLNDEDNEHPDHEIHITEDGYIVCMYCGIEGASRSELVDHINRKHRKQRRWFACKKCPFIAPSKADIQLHRHIVHPCYKCSICGFKGKTQSALEYHCKLNHYKGEDRLKCPYCSYITFLPESYEKHMKKHDSEGSDEEMISCFQCKYKTKRTYDLKRHLLKKHNEDYRQQCFLCEYTAEKTFDFKKHLIESRNGVFLQKCTLCNYKTVDVALLKKHLARHLENAQHFPCPHCPFHARSKKFLSQHIEIMHV